MLLQRAKHTSAVWGTVSCSWAQHSGDHATSVARKEDDKTEKQKRDVTVKKVKKLLNFPKEQKKFNCSRCYLSKDYVNSQQ